MCWNLSLRAIPYSDGNSSLTWPPCKSQYCIMNNCAMSFTTGVSNVPFVTIMLFCFRMHLSLHILQYQTMKPTNMSEMRCITSCRASYWKTSWPRFEDTFWWMNFIRLFFGARYLSESVGSFENKLRNTIRLCYIPKWLCKAFTSSSSRLYSELRC